MLKARSRKLSLVLILAMLMTMFVGLGTAGAATGYSATHVPLVDTNDWDDLGAVIVEFDNLPTGDNGFILKLPADFKLSKDTFTGDENDYGSITDTVYGVTLTPVEGVFVFVAYAENDNRANVTVRNDTGNILDELKFALNLKNVFIPSDAPDVINATLVAQPKSVFADGIVQVGRTGSASVTALAGDPITVTGSGSEKPVKINFRENKPFAFEEGSNSLTLKLPKGFEWSNWKMQTLDRQEDFEITDPDPRTLKFKRLGNVSDAYIWEFTADIIVDESVAQFGDITVTIGGSSNISPSSVVVGKYADYGIEVVVDDPETEVIAGRHEQYVSDFAFKENIGDSLLEKRTIYVELPEGVEWDINALELIPDTSLYDISSWYDDDGGVTFGDGTGILKNDPDTLKIVIDRKTNTKGTLGIKDAMVKIAGNFSGDIKAKVWGNAGISDEIILAKAIAPISVKADIEDIKIGLQKQAGGTIVITEAAAEAITTDDYWLKKANDEDVYSLYGNDDTFLTVSLPFNVYWGDIPTVKVIEGDIELGTVSTSKEVLTIPIKNSSSVPSKIEISDVTYTVDRTVPEGDMKATFAGSALVQTYFTNRNYVVKEVVANCVTPAPGETIGSGEFRIGSNIYYVGGVAKVMDVAPYIKDSRTYVPMRYLGEILGAEVVWDDAARTVTLTRGDTTVVFTIGSTTYTVNGEAKTADVAPEITNSRTMLPARFVAEAFGAVVGWDAATQTVLIQK